MLTDPQRPALLVLAGKAHPADDEGKRMIQAWITLVQQPELRSRVVFLEDYDIELAAELVQGVDLCTNMPRGPWDACGTSGMKILVDGGLNLSVLDGWWEEAYEPGAGWAFGMATPSTKPRATPATRRRSTTSSKTRSCRISYDRDQARLPRRWLARIRCSLARLTPAYSTNRMLSEYIDAPAEFARCRQIELIVTGAAAPHGFGRVRARPKASPVPLRHHRPRR